MTQFNKADTEQIKGSTFKDKKKEGCMGVDVSRGSFRQHCISDHWPHVHKTLEVPVDLSKEKGIPENAPRLRG